MYAGLGTACLNIKRKFQKYVQVCCNDKKRKRKPQKSQEVSGVFKGEDARKEEEEGVLSLTLIPLITLVESTSNLGLVVGLFRDRGRGIGRGANVVELADGIVGRGRHSSNDGQDLSRDPRVFATGAGTVDRAEGVAAAVGLHVDGHGAACSLAVDLSRKG